MLHRRDRGIGTTCDAGNGFARLSCWLDRLVAPDSTPAANRAQMAATLNLVNLVFYLSGMLVGGGAAAAALRYDGSHPINIVNALAVLVGIQVLLLPLLLLAVLPRRTAMLAALQDVLGTLNVARLAGPVLRLAPAHTAAALRQLLDGTPAARGVARWAALSLSQAFAVGFNIAALASTAALVGLSDLAFGWSTTLAAEAAAFQRLTDAVSLPWSAIWPAAVPSAELIEASRYFRLGNEAAGGDPAALTGWWPFLVACLTTYGLLPRLLTLLYCRRRLNSAARAAIMAMPGASEVLERMRAPLVETAAPEPSADALPSQPGPPEHAPLSCAAAAVVAWGDFSVPTDTLAAHAAERLGATISAAFEAGGGASLEHDRDVQLDLLKLPDGTAVLFLVKAWEPPLRELTDFVLAVQPAATRPVVIAPCAFTPDGNVAEVTGADAAVWQYAIAALGVPHVHVNVDAPTA
ncbi:MAG: DUF2868 domain-containing protein [Gammaproteobacteria bacterium]|nr:DUF2868 domain-containing protein [Gammaproteobacteria bacterium]NNM01196.1 DUF2868 domain-containing protein [Gammaproteobacteria bacterium]